MALGINDKDEKMKARGTSSLYDWKFQDMHGLGMSGLQDYYDAEFVDLKTGKIHFTTQVVIEKDYQWSFDGERLLFNGFLYDFVTEDEFPLFVVLDVKNKRFLHVYKGYAEHPRWNVSETDALFDNVLEPYEDLRIRLQKNSWAQELSRNLPVIHFENEQVVEEDGRLYVGESVSPNQVHKVRFYKVGEGQDDAFEVRFWPYRKKDGQWSPLNWAMSNMVNGVDGFGWVDDDHIIYTEKGDRIKNSHFLSTLDFRS